MSRFLLGVVCVFALAICDLILCLFVMVALGLVAILELSDAGKFPLCVYAWKQIHPAEPVANPARLRRVA
ncbi:MAG TPA: hypothetical protein VNG04_00645 [Candidatus Acidoferrum sp.]|nr:hypothetical protein [Candidatus Acidoferrum sp.]